MDPEEGDQRSPRSEPDLIGAQSPSSSIGLPTIAHVVAHRWPDHPMAGLESSPLPVLDSSRAASETSSQARRLVAQSEQNLCRGKFFHSAVQRRMFLALHRGLTDLVEVVVDIGAMRLLSNHVLGSRFRRSQRSHHQDRGAHIESRC